jgi:hypothetical protein
MCRNSFLSMIFFFACSFFWLSTSAFQSNQAPISNQEAFDLTATSIRQENIGRMTQISASITAASQPSRTPDAFSLTATSIIATATAMADPNCTVDLRYYIFDYSYENGENWEQNPDIQATQNTMRCSDSVQSLSHQLTIWTLDLPSNETLATVIEDFVSRLPDYPPSMENGSINIALNTINYGPFPVGSFTYLYALSLYDDGLRGLDLMETLRIPSIDSVILRNLSYIQTMTANEAANPESIPFELTLTAVIETATAAPTITPDAFSLTATSIIQTATAMAHPTEIDRFDLTATSMVATATANAQGANPQPSQNPILLTATAIIKEATERAATQSR